VPLMDVGFAIICSLARHRRPQIQFLSIGSRVCSTLLSDLTSRFGPCASLSLHLHQAVKRTFTSKLSNMLGNRHRGSGRPLSPATPPYMRVRVRRFNGLRWTSEQPRKTDGVKVGDRKRNGQGRAVGKTPGAVAASYRVSDKGDAHSSLA
jgi:hypothetical protein